jgi:hypothetical protein
MRLAWWLSGVAASTVELAAGWLLAAGVFLLVEQAVTTAPNRPTPVLMNTVRRRSRRYARRMGGLKFLGGQSFKRWQERVDQVAALPCCGRITAPLFREMWHLSADLVADRSDIPTLGLRVAGASLPIGDDDLGVQARIPAPDLSCW